MIKIFYDGVMFYKEKYGGISNVYREILKRLSDNADFRCAITLPNNNACEEITKINKYLIPKIRPNRYYPYYWKILNEFYLNKFKPDIFHSTYYTEPIFNIKVKKILTIHDMINEIYCNYINTKACNRFVKFKKHLVDNADFIICVSNSTKNDVLNYYEVDSSKICVIYNSINEIFKGEESEDKKVIFRRKYELLRPYILYVGRIAGVHKNFALLLKSYVENNLINSKRDLVIVSSDNYTSDESRQIDKFGPRIRKFAKLTVQELKMIYNCADIFVYPSKYEGFGIPILEAMACGTPVLASGTSSIPEVGGNAALYFDPNSYEDLYTKLKELIESEVLKKRLIKSGYENIKRFSWEKNVGKLCEIYKTLC